MRYVLLAAAAFAMLSGAAYADSTSSSTANSNSSSGSSSTSALRLNNHTTTNVIVQDPSTGASGSGAGSSTGSSTGSDPTIHYSGGYTIRNTPEVIPPSVVGGNPCAVGASGGVAVAGFGISMGGTWADRACERRQQAALLFNMGEKNVAAELMCQDEHVRAAMKVAGQPCAADTLADARSPAASSAVQPRVPAPAAMQAARGNPARSVRVVAIASTAMAAKPEWCARAAPTTEAAKVYVAQVCGTGP